VVRQEGIVESSAALLAITFSERTAGMSDVDSDAGERVIGPAGDDDAIMVFVRARPLLPQEVEVGESAPREIWSYQPTAIVEESDMSHKAHSFDRVFAPGATNEEVYERCAQKVVHRALQGTNGTVCAYGQTSSGKTFSMLGTHADPGIVPRAIHDVFEHIEEAAAVAGGSAVEFLVRVSYLEVR
jgi:centromeric protein E